MEPISESVWRLWSCLRVFGVGVWDQGSLRNPTRNRERGSLRLLCAWRIMGLSKYGYKYPKWGYK